MTLAERPHPFPSRTRKLSSPAPKILRGQPFGKIGRRQDFCVSGPGHAPIPRSQGRVRGHPDRARGNGRTGTASAGARAPLSFDAIDHEPGTRTVGRPSTRMRSAAGPGTTCPYLARGDRPLAERRALARASSARPSARGDPGRRSRPSARAACFGDHRRLRAGYADAIAAHAPGGPARPAARPIARDGPGRDRLGAAPGALRHARMLADRRRSAGACSRSSCSVPSARCSWPGSAPSSGGGGRQRPASPHLSQAPSASARRGGQPDADAVRDCRVADGRPPSASPKPTATPKPSTGADREHDLHGASRATRCPSIAIQVRDDGQGAPGAQRDQGSIARSSPARSAQDARRPRRVSAGSPGSTTSRTRPA